MNLHPGTKPIKVYKSTISAVIGVILYTAIIAILVWVVVSAFSWIMLILMGGMAYPFIKQMIYYIRCRHEQIVITERHLFISQCVKQTRDGDWVPMKDVQLPWSSINNITAQWEHPTSKSIRKNVLVRVGRNKKKELYMIDPDIFDLFFLERKLQDYLRQFGSPVK